MEGGRHARPVHASREVRELRTGGKPLSTNHIRLILRYRQESLADIINTYPANSRPIVPTVFRITLNALIVPPFQLISCSEMPPLRKRKRSKIEGRQDFMPSAISGTSLSTRRGGRQGRKIPTLEPTRSSKMPTGAVALSELFGSRCARSDTLGSDCRGQVQWRT